LPYISLISPLLLVYFLIFQLHNRNIRLERINLLQLKIV
jgi:hypothetical protein